MSFRTMLQHKTQPSRVLGMPEFSFSPSTKILHFLLCDFILDGITIKTEYKEKTPEKNDDCTIHHS